LSTPRSLVQIKSHAQKVLKRLEAGENVFRRLEENYNVIDSLIVQAAKQRDALLNSSAGTTATRDIHRFQPIALPREFGFSGNHRF
jgi:hypothetical protein